MKEGYFFIALGKYYLNELQTYLLRSKYIFNDPRPFTILVLEEDYAQASTLTNSVRVFDLDEVRREFNGKIKCDFELYGTIPKLKIPQLTPYEKTIFIDSDCIFLENPDTLWRVFQNAKSIGLPGYADSLNAAPREWHWGKIAEVELRVGKPVPQLSSGVIYLNNERGECDDLYGKLSRIFISADSFDIKPFFRGGIPDEIVYAIHMGIEGIRPYNFDEYPIQTLCFENTLPVYHSELDRRRIHVRSGEPYIIYHDCSKTFIRRDKIIKLIK